MRGTQRSWRRRGLGLSALALLLALGLPAAPAAQTFGKNKVQYKEFEFRTISSPHFDVYFYEGGDSLAIRVLDLAEKSHLKLSRDFGHVLSHKVPIILYNSANDFRQTNVITDFIGEGTGGFTELLRNRVVLPFTGSYEDLRHVVVHELTHAYMFDMLFGGGLTSVIGRGSFFVVPLWFAEGLAEWESMGWDPEAEMFVRDGIITGYLPPLPFAGGFLVYKLGQGAIRYLVERHGEERLRDLLRRMKFHRNFDRAFEAAMGTTVAQFDRDYRTWLRRTYWPSISEKSNPEVYARRLTDHRRDGSNLNTGAAVSPNGDRIAYFSDRQQYTDVYVMSALDGKVLNRVVRGQRNVAFESIPSFRSALAWSPEGDRIAFTAQSQSRDVLYVSDAESGEVLRKHKLDFDAVLFPAWHPESETLAVVGVRDGRSDLYLVGPEGEVTRLTRDAWDEKEVTWSPDGRHLVFSSDRANPVVLTADRRPRGFGDYGIWQLEVETGVVSRVIDTYGEDTNPAYAPDGRRLAFVSDRGGAKNIYLYDLRDSSFTQLTDLVGGVFSLSWSRENDRLVFSAFNEGGWDVFAAKEPLSLDAVVARLREERPSSRISWGEMQKPADLATAPPEEGGQGALAPTWPDTTIGSGSSLALNRTSLADSLRGSDLARRSRLYEEPVARDTLRPVGLVSVIDPESRDEPFALPDSLLHQRPRPYRPQFAAEFAGGGLQYNSAFGLAGSTQLSISDFLGNHRVFLATDVFSSSLDETNLLAIYNYLPKRTDFGVGVFHFKNYFFSRVSSVGEQFSQPRFFSDRNFGVLASASYPFSRFRRLDLDFTQVVVQRQFFDEVGDGLFLEGERETRLVTAPTATLVHDDVLYGFYGPVNGSRWFLSVSPALPVFGNSLSYRTTIADYRRYLNLGGNYQIALRGVGAFSWGRDAQVFEVGGFSTVRGFDDFELDGTRAVFSNLELRFPFISALGVVGPLPLGFFNLRGVVFLDNAVVWNEGDSPRLLGRDENGDRRLQDLKTSFGVGVRSILAFLIVKLDVGWQTDFQKTSSPQWHFSLGPEF